MHHRNRRDLLGWLIVASVALASVCDGFVVRCTRLLPRLDQIPLCDSAATAIPTGTAKSARQTRPSGKDTLRDLTCLTKIPRWDKVVKVASLKAHVTDSRMFYMQAL